MGSSRLPGKVMMPLAGHSVLAHVLGRCGAIAGIDVVCCATTDTAGDDIVATEAARRGAVVFRGSETDVLERYAGAAEALDADIVMRVTSDCPLIDPEICARVLALRREENADYASNVMPRGWPHGLDCEVFTAASLGRAMREAVDSYDREHVTPWIRDHPEVRCANLAGPDGDLTAHRWTLDYPEDMRFFEALFAHLPPRPAIAGMAQVLAILDEHPAIAAINAMRRMGK